MRKFSVEYVKKNPVLFVVILIVFGLLVWVMLNRGASSGSGAVSVVNSGPSEAEIMAGAQLQLAQIQAGAATQQAQIQAAAQLQAGQLQLAAIQEQGNLALAIAGLDAQYKTLELASSERVASKTIDAQLMSLDMQLDNAYNTTVANNQFMVDYARVAADSATQQLQIGAALQAELSAQQLDAFKYGTDAQLEQFKIGTIAATIPSLKKNKRDNALAGLINVVSGAPADTPLPKNSSGGGGGGFSLSGAALGGAVGAIL